MPQIVEAPELGVLEFPDGMSQEEMGDAIELEYARRRTAAAEADAPRLRRKTAAIEAGELLARGLAAPAYAANVLADQVRSGAQGVRRLGDLAAGVATDVMAGNVLPTGERLAPRMINTGAAFAGEEMPDAGALTTVQRGVADAARAVPPIAASMFAAAGGVPAPAAFGGVMGVLAHEESGGDPRATALAAASGALVPGVAAAGRQAAARALGKAIEGGLLSGERTLVQKSMEALGAQGALQVFFEGMNVPQYAQMSPEERREAITRSVVANTALLGLDLPAVFGGGPSVVQAQRAARAPKEQAGEFAGQVMRELLVASGKPEALDVLREAVDAEVVRAMTPQPTPERPETLRSQLALTANPESTKAVTLVTPGAAVPAVPAGLEVVETPHGVAVFNPAKTSKEAVEQAGAGRDFDGRLLGMSQERKPIGPTAVIETTLDGVPVLDEVVSQNEAAMVAAAEAHQAAVPGGETSVRPAEDVVAARLAGGGGEMPARALSGLAGPDMVAGRAETITGSNEGKASEMPAEPGESPGPRAAQPPPQQKPRPRRRASAGAEERPWDLLDWMEGNRVRVRGLKVARPGETGYYGEIYRALSKTGYGRKYISNASTARAWDEVVDDARRDGVIGKDASVEDFQEALIAAVGARKGAAGQRSREQVELERLVAQQEDFDQAARQGRRAESEPAAGKPLPVTELVEGDVFTLAGAEVRVREMVWDPETLELAHVVLEDGRRFEVKTVGADEVIYPDAGSVKSAAPADAWSVPEAEAEAEAKTDPWTLDEAESVEAQKAREAAEAEQARREAQEEEMARRQAAPLSGSSADVGQGSLFASGEDLFSGPSAERRAASGGQSSYGTKGYGYPGGPLGDRPAGPADDPRHSVFPVELPEAVEFAESLTGQRPVVQEKMRRRGVLGTFSPGEGGLIRLLASTADLLTDAEKAALRAQALEYARSVADQGENVGEIAEAKYRHLIEQAYEEAKRRNPLVALKVLWHEIGHAVDWLPDHVIHDRGNILGRIASLKRYLKHWLPLDPGSPNQPPTPSERMKMRREAEAALRREMGPIEEIVETILVEEPIYRTVGVTAEDVKRLLGMDARESMPELYRWFAEQPSEVKRDILRAAMKGMVDARVPAEGKEQIGTRQVERSVRKKAGREPSQAEIDARFREMLRKEMEKRRLVQIKDLKAELEPLIAWWHGTETIPGYFTTPVEMYADAFSVFMNNPAAVAKRAPKYYELMHNYMERKPEVQALYNEIQDRIKTGTVERHRVERLRESWRRDAELNLTKWRERLATRLDDVLENTRYYYDQRFGPVFRLVKRLPGHERVRAAIGDFDYRMTEHEYFLRQMEQTVSRRLVDHNLDWNDLGEYLFHKRIENERFNLYNPLGWSSKTSMERMESMRGLLGPARWKALEQAAADFRKLYEDVVIREMRDARMWGPELQKKIDDNIHYATFAVARGLPERGIERELELAFGTGVTPKIFRQIGTLKDIKNPATATVLKALSMVSAARRNVAKREVIQFLQRAHPEDVAPARERFNGKRWEPVIEDNDRIGTVVYLDDGKAKAFYTRRLIADALTGGSSEMSSLVRGMLHATSAQKGLFTQLNYAFWPWNFVRDTMGFWLKMPGLAAPLHWARHLPQAVAAARASVNSRRRNAVADDALRRLMVISRADPRGVLSDVADEYELQVASYGMDPVAWDREARKIGAWTRAWNRYREAGQAFERVNKLAGMLYLDERFPEMPEYRKREIVRERAGSPNFLEKGAANWHADTVALFYNAWKQEIRAVAHAARENPFSFATKAAAGGLVPSVLMAAAASGVLGGDKREMYESVPSHDLLNYFVLPLGWADRERRKVRYLRLPLPDPLRQMHGLTFQALSGRGPGPTGLVWGMLPSVNPLLRVAGAWSAYLLGVQPTDDFTGRDIVSKTEMDAGGAAPLKGLAKWTWNELGGGLIKRFRDARADEPAPTSEEEFLAMPVVGTAVGKWIKVSDRGLYEEDARAARPVVEHRARVRLAVDEMMRRQAQSGGYDQLLAAAQAQDTTAMAQSIALMEPTEAERLLLRDPYALSYYAENLKQALTHRASPELRRLDRIQTTEGKARVLQRMVPAPAP